MHPTQDAGACWFSCLQVGVRPEVMVISSTSSPSDRKPSRCSRIWVTPGIAGQSSMMGYPAKLMPLVTVPELAEEVEIIVWLRPQKAVLVPLVMETASLSTLKRDVSGARSWTLYTVDGAAKFRNTYGAKLAPTSIESGFGCVCPNQLPSTAFR